MAHLSISFLGTLHVTRDGEPVTDFGTDKARALLAYLAVEADRPHRRDVLAGLLWPEQPQRKARQSLRQALSHLRQAIGDDDDTSLFLLISRKTIQFNLESDHHLDVAALAGLIEDCETHRHRRLATCLPCLRRMERMADRYRGPFLEQFFVSDSDAFEEWAVLKREWLQREVTAALSLLTDYYGRRGEIRKARQYARRQVQMEPWHEEAHRQLMRLLALDDQRSAALAQYETCRQALAVELGIEPTAETQALYEQIRDGETRGPGEGETGRGGDKERGKLEEVISLSPCLPLSLSPCLLVSPSPCLPLPLSPAPTPFVGRADELADLADLLANPDCRLVTLFGPGGIGKTRLALQVAADHLGVFADEVAFVPLASVDALEHLAPAIASALDVPLHGERDPQEQLLSYLRRKELLLVLDNMEHILEGTGFLSTLLRRAPGVVLLVTSRERLNLREEWVVEIEGLAYPEQEDDKVQHGYSAIDLFEQWAGQVDQRFTLSETELPHVARICRMMEGLPLGIELAASWVTVHSCEEIAEQLSSSLDILTTRMRNVTERHRSLRAAFEHSFQLLTEEEKNVFAGLCVFRGGFSPEAAEAVTGASLPLLTALQDKSLIRRVASKRYTMHEMLRQYGLDKLRCSRSLFESARAQHVDYFAPYLGQRENAMRGEGQKQALQEIECEIDNVRQAWQVAVAQGWAEQAAQSLESLYHFYTIRGWFKEGIALFALAIDRWREEPEQKVLFGKALARQGVFYRRTGRYDLARDGLRQGLEIFKALQVHREQAFCLTILAEAAWKQGQHKEALDLAQKGFDLSRECQDFYHEAYALFILGGVQFRLGQIERAKALYEKALATSRAHGNRRLEMSILNALGDCACHPGNYVEARNLFQSCLALSRELDDAYNTAQYLNNLGTVLHVLDQYEEAQQHYQESLDICCRIGDLSGQAIALSNLGEIAHILDAHEQALLYYQEALDIGRDTQENWSILVCLNNLGETACALKDWTSAKAYLSEALDIAQQAQIILLLPRVLVNLALFFAGQGQGDRAALLLGLVIHHPSSEQDIREKAERLLDELGLALPEATPVSLDAVIAELLAELV